ncbi:MAG: glycosyltransferase family 4 protein [Candidatus Omnitrophota bacterium]
MIVGYDGRILVNLKCGIAVYLTNLLNYYIKEPAIEKIYIFSDKPTHIIYSSLLSNSKINLIVFGKPGSTSYFQSKLPLQLKKYSVKIYHAIWNNTVPLFSPCPVVLTIHDLIPWVIGGFKNKRKEYKYKLNTFISAHRANKIITVSNNSKNDIIKYLKIKEDKIKVIYNALDEEKQKINLTEINSQQVLNRYKIDGRYIICSSGIDTPRRNIEILLKAYLDLMVLKKYNVKLVFIGNVNRDNLYTNYIIGLIKKLNLSNEVILTGWINDYDLMALLKKAEFMVFPSFYEGFGFPVLEAFWASIPVIAAKTSVLYEIAEDAVIYFDLFSQKDLLSKMVMLLENDELKIQLIQKGKARLKKFSWQKTAEETLKVYNSLIGGRNIS